MRSSPGSSSSAWLAAVWVSGQDSAPAEAVASVSVAVSVSSAMRVPVTGAPCGASVDQHLLDQDGVRLRRRDHQVDAAQDLHAELVGALAAGEILGTQLAQEGLEHVLQPGHVRLKGVDRLLV